MLRRLQLDHRIARLSIELEHARAADTTCQPNSSHSDQVVLSTTTRTAFQPIGAVMEQHDEPKRDSKAHRPSVDLMAVSFNSQRWLPGFLKSLSRMDYPAASLRLV